jgi:hypothetical protein
MDPIKFDAGDPNIFRYVGNDPLNWTDPWGYGAEAVFGSAAAEAAFGAAAAAMLSKELADLVREAKKQSDKDNGGECDSGSSEKHPLKNREKRNKERRERPKDPIEKEKRQRANEEKKQSVGAGGRTDVNKIDY